MHKDVNMFKMPPRPSQISPVFVSWACFSRSSSLALNKALVDG